MPCRIEKGKQVCTRTNWWRSAMNIEWYGSYMGSGGSQPPTVPTLFVSELGSGNESGSDADNSMPEATFLTYELQDNDYPVFNRGDEF